MWPEATISACELDPDRAACLKDAGANIVVVGGATEVRFPDVDLCITNPPFSLAMDFIKIGQRVAHHSAVLERLNYLGSLDRAPFWRAYPPELLILPRRPSFAASLKCKRKAFPVCGWKATMMLDDDLPRACPMCGAQVSKVTTDSVEYAWFLWGFRAGTWSIAELDK